ncbi:hypothetical protein SAMD00019534_076610, partial [Acytostelium subglobosum LB1]|uniref:hypothetical protein n=1 Tax=Acytostelium subglobosum LB1 TaxID=1410327 RepID=UPI0006448C2D
NEQVHERTNMDKQSDILKRINNEVGSDPNNFMRVLTNQSNGALVYLIGTSHVSKTDAKRVSQIMDIVKPDTVFVEMCKGREVLLRLPEQQLRQVIARRPNIPWLGTTKFDPVVLSALSTFYYYATKATNHISGMEMRVASQYAKDNKCRLVLGDRDQQ